MECSTVAVDCDDYSLTISQKIVTARKHHMCYECHRTIIPGERYERYFGGMGGTFSNKTCSDCLSVREEFFNDGYPFGGIWEYLIEHIRDCGYDISESSIQALTPTAQAKICDEIQNGWDDEEDEDA